MEKLEAKIDILSADIALMQTELRSTIMVHETKIIQHDKELTHAFDDIHKLEDRSWRASGAVLLGTISFIATASLGLLTYFLR